MAAEELGGYLIVAGYGALLLGAIRLFGLRRVLVVVFGGLFIAVFLAARVMLGVASARRY